LLIYVGLICIPPGPFVPFEGIWSGVKALVYDSDCALGIIEEKPTETFSIFPNPAKKELNISNIKGGSIDQVSIFDLTGKLILQDNTGANNLQIETLSSGIYIIQIEVNGNTLEQKLIVE
jgi:hypothetical protein